MAGAEKRSMRETIPPPNQSNEPKWAILENYTTTIQIDAGKRFYIYFDNNDKQLKTMPIDDLPSEFYSALAKVPEWLKDNLTYKFRQLSPTKRITYANLIINSPDPKYIDEIAFCIAHNLSCAVCH